MSRRKPDTRYLVEPTRDGRPHEDFLLVIPQPSEPEAPHGPDRKSFAKRRVMSPKLISRLLSLAAPETGETC
jgi:hypothetical protein